MIAPQPTNASRSRRLSRRCYRKIQRISAAAERRRLLPDVELFKPAAAPKASGGEQAGSEYGMLLALITLVVAGMMPVIAKHSSVVLAKLQGYLHLAAST